MIEICRLQKSFGAVQALAGVSLDLREGEVTALIGPNGSGKSTMIKLLLGLARPSAGEIFFDGEPIDGAWEYRSAIGYMPQAPSFPGNLTVREIHRMVTDLRGLPATTDEELWARFSLEREGDKAVKTLSGGTRQKLNAAIAFLFRPRLLILDEPTVSLDPLSAAILKEKILKERKNGRTVLITSHIMAEVETLADRIIYLCEGSVLFDESMNNLLRQTGTHTLEQAVLHQVGGR